MFMGISTLKVIVHIASLNVAFILPLFFTAMFLLLYVGLKFAGVVVLGG